MTCEGSCFWGSSIPRAAALKSTQNQAPLAQGDNKFCPQKRFLEEQGKFASTGIVCVISAVSTIKIKNKHHTQQDVRLGMLHQVPL